MKKILCFIVLCLTLTACNTNPTLEEVINKVSFDTSEIQIDITISNKNDEIKCTYIVSEENNFIKTIKTQDGITEINVLYKENNKYFLYQKIDTPEVIDLSDLDGNNFFDKLRKEVVNLKSYLEVDYDNVKYYTYTEDKVSYSNYRENIFYDNILEVNDNKLISLTQVFGINNVVNTTYLEFTYNFNIEIPKI